MLLVLAGEGACREDLVGERDDEDAERGGDELHQVVETDARQVETRQARRNLPDDRDPVSREVERPRQRDPADDDQERGRQLWHQEPEREERRERREADQKRGTTRIAEVAENLSELCE